MKSNKDTKYLVLDQNDTLNPHPEKVSDPLFQEHDFFDARDLIQVKYEMLRRVNFEKWPISQASETFGFSRPSFYKCLNAFQNNGLVGLIPHKRGPKNAHKLSPLIMVFIEEILKENQGLKAKNISKKVEEKFNLKIHLRSIQRALNKSKKKRN
jgi:transposase